MPLDDTSPAASPASWRDRIAVHPAADLFPMMAGDELIALGADIKGNGLQSPVVLFGPKGGGILALIDGRNRLDAAEAAGLPVIGDCGGLLVPHDIIEEPPGFDPVAFVVSANLNRRHLTGEQRRGIIERLLTERPERSNRAIGKVVQADHKTVAAVRDDLEGRGEIPHVETRTDTKGREQPAHKPPPAPTPAPSQSATPTPTPPPPPKPPASRAHAKAMMAFAAALHADRAETLDGLTRILRDECTLVAAEIPLPRRVALIRGYMHALGVTLADLQPVQ